EWSHSGLDDSGQLRFRLPGTVVALPLRERRGCSFGRGPRRGGDTNPWPAQLLLGPTMNRTRLTKPVRSAAPLTGQQAHETQAFGSVVPMPIALAEKTRRASVDNLNQLLADTIPPRDLYKKHHWQVSGPTFYQLHLLFDKHFDEQNELVDRIGERVMMLGGVS